MRMGLDDSKYLLQLARADVLTLPESPGDWDSVTVKSPKQGSPTPGQDPSKSATMSPNTTRHPSGASPSAGPTRSPQTTQHSPATAQKASPPQTRQNYTVPTPSEARRQVTGPKSPPTHKGRGEYRMALVSTIQPSFGTHPSEPSPKDEHMKDNPASKDDR